MRAASFAPIWSASFDISSRSTFSASLSTNLPLATRESMPLSLAVSMGASIDAPLKSPMQSIANEASRRSLLLPASNGSISPRSVLYVSSPASSRLKTLWLATRKLPILESASLNPSLVNIFSESVPPIVRCLLIVIDFPISCNRSAR